ncbi:MAG: two-component system response regulator GlrR, partial [Gammaproteobacteria bacterium]
GQIIPLTMAKKALRDEPGQLQTLKEATHTFEGKYLTTVLRLANGNVANAARMAGRNRTEFYKLLSQHQLTPANFRTPDQPGD